MRSLFFVLFSFLLTANIFAARLEIRAPALVSVERFERFQVTYIDDNGSRMDVTSSVRFKSMDRISTNSFGDVKIHVPFNINSPRLFTRIEAEYVNDSNLVVRSSVNLSVDLTPDFINIVGPSSVMSRGYARFNAYGSYSGVRANLTNAGNWRARYGSLGFGGSYRAPSTNGRSTLSDSVTFSFGSRYAYKNVYVR